MRIWRKYRHYTALRRQQLQGMRQANNMDAEQKEWQNQSMWRIFLYISQSEVGNRQILQLAFNSDVYPFHSVQIVEASYDRGLSVWCKFRPFPCLRPCSYPPTSNNQCSFRPCDFSRANIKHAKADGSVLCCSQLWPTGYLPQAAKGPGKNP